VPPGVHVEAGDPIMISGFSGAVVPEGPAGAHLHFQIQLDHGAGPLVCPQAALQAWASGQVLDVRTLPTTGCFN
jgi:murein DD-endopeptidase MepM/ murein hydrolase activator NlpD